MQYIHGFLMELRKRKGVGARALEFTILTGSRTRPLLLAKWEDIDFDESAIITTSEGPAILSIPTSPKTAFFAKVT